MPVVWTQAELKRLYTQLQVYKMKTMRRDNPHVSKRRGRKSTHRRFSLQAFQHKHRLQQSAEHSVSDVHDLELASRTPEESTNSAETAAQPPATLVEEPASIDSSARPRKQWTDRWKRSTHQQGMRLQETKFLTLNSNAKNRCSKMEQN